VFVSFFPNPRIFFWSAVLWTAIAIAVWYSFGKQLSATFGLLPHPEETASTIGVSVFWSDSFLWFYLYYWATVALFAAFWMIYAPHPWVRWSILGSALIIFATYYQVQVSVAINNWYGPFYDMVQAALSKSRPVTLAEFYAGLVSFAGIACVAVVIAVLTRFFVSHYIFRWRTAMNDYYMSHWSA
jgi:peptide/bleomycin uptake transporter